ncbi:hypothetical protein DFP87_104170 [Achromobacter marplatensis]|uniref:Uncharacterized protein n=1 Tax=Achromobacter marplatensis TaxID=470868 RepID=A0ABX9G9G4_9BURK|nr:hypothetical protein DFP87_104170 [Achromobacter marplatensis]CAB3636706.1 hypothetical protein LMG26219_01718 [Achromobacter marplatensis]
MSFFFCRAFITVRLKPWAFISLCALFEPRLGELALSIARLACC